MITSRYARTVALTVALLTTAAGSAARAEERPAGPAAAAEAAAAASFRVAEEAYAACEALTLPPFRARKTLPPDVRRWWSEKLGPDRAREWTADLRGMAPAERAKQMGSVQFQHWAAERFVPWLEKRDAARELAESRYREVFDHRVPAWQVAALSRVGELHLSEGEAIAGAPMDPSIIGDQELEAIYRSALAERAALFFEAALESFRHCVEVASASHIDDAWSRGCQQKLDLLGQRSH